MNKIKTANDQLHVQANGGLKNVVRKAAIINGHIPNWTEQGAVQAEINHGRWIVKCPSCPGALDAEPGVPFFCPDCGNGANGGKSYSVIFPENRGAIEEILLKRPKAENQNWEPGETVAFLLAENAMGGIE